jgi:hypothetical protein
MRATSQVNASLAAKTATADVSDCNRLRKRDNSPISINPFGFTCFFADSWGVIAK